MNSVSSLSNTAYFKMHGLPEPNQPVQARKLLDSSKAMEQLFAQHMVAELGKTLPGTGSVTGGQIYADMFKDAITTKISEGGNLGIAKNLYLSMAEMAQITHKTDEVEQ